LSRKTLQRESRFLKTADHVRILSPAEPFVGLRLFAIIVKLSDFCRPISAMKTKAEILKILQEEKPELVRRYGVKRLALFGSYAREFLVEIEPQTEVVSRRAIKPRYWEIIQRELVDVP
jgi:predicted nucleotidyltransferase